MNIFKANSLFRYFQIFYCFGLHMIYIVNTRRNWRANVMYIYIYMLRKLRMFLVVIATDEEMKRKTETRSFRERHL